MSSPSLVCSICDTPISPDMEAVCNNCGLPYHFRQREDQPGEDCGEAWISTEHLALEFACNACLEAARAPEPAAVDAVLTAPEAAERAGLSVEALTAMADEGAVRSRKAGNVYLFEAADIAELAARDGA